MCVHSTGVGGRLLVSEARSKPPDPLALTLSVVSALSQGGDILRLQVSFP